MKNISTSTQTGTIGGPKPGVTPLDDVNKRELDKMAQQDADRGRAVGDKLSMFLKRLRDDIETLNRERRLELFRQQIKAHKYFDGNFYGYVNANCEWVNIEREAGETWYSDNQLYPYIRTALMELSRTQTEVVVNANSESEKMQNVAKFAQMRYNKNRERLFDALLKQTENAYAILNGVTYRYTFANWQAPGARKEKMPRLQRRDTDASPKAALCTVCYRPKPEQTDMAKELTDMAKPAKCRCGSELFREFDGFQSDKEVVIGYDEVPRCENAFMIPNPVGVIVSLTAARITETPFILWKQIILRSVLEQKYRGVMVPSTGVHSMELRYITDQQRATPAQGTGTIELGFGEFDSNRTLDSANELEEIEFHQVWLDYAVYCNKSFPEDMPLSHGKVLKAGQKLGTMFPKGLYFAIAGDVVLDMWDEDKNRKWSSSPYGLRPGSMYGTGTSVALPDQELANDAIRLEMANAWSNGVPREFVDPAIIPEISADPQVPTIFHGEPGMSNVVGRGYAQAPATTLGPDVYAIRPKASEAIQAKTGAMSSSGSGGMSDTQKWGDTATAISIKRDLAVGRFSPDLQLMADLLDREQAYQFLENEKEFFTPEQWKELKGEYADETVKDFLKCDVRRDLNISIVPGSYMPKSDAQVQSKFITLAQLLPEVIQTGNPELVAHAFEVFGMPERMGAWTSDRSSAARITERYRALTDKYIEEFGDVPAPNLEDPMVRQVVELMDRHANAPIDVFLDNHDALAEAYRDQRATDEGREWSNLLIACISKRVLEHQAGRGKQQQMVARVAQMAAEPIKEEVDAEAAAAEEKEAAATEAQMIGQMVQYNDADENRRADLAKTQMQLDTQKELKAAEIEAQAALAAAKPATPARPS
jgi:hypothetical protein